MLPHAQALVEKFQRPTDIDSGCRNMFPSILKLDNIDTVGFQVMLPKKRVFTSQDFHTSLVALVSQQKLNENPYIFTMFPENKRQ